ncbi:hypothetical protein CSB09_04340 [Candidatus Gracilibacteria bacterium]|nr:MAG: hypothetical protein CSB09_04340 [Candidatus Gracilibacteria bacterium]
MKHKKKNSTLPIIYKILFFTFSLGIIIAGGFMVLCGGSFLLTPYGEEIAFPSIIFGIGFCILGIYLIPKRHTLLKSKLIQIELIIFGIILIFILLVMGKFL